MFPKNTPSLQQWYFSSNLKNISLLRSTKYQERSIWVVGEEFQLKFHLKGLELRLQIPKMVLNNVKAKFLQEA